MQRVRCARLRAVAAADPGCGSLGVFFVRAFIVSVSLAALAVLVLAAAPPLPQAQAEAVPQPKPQTPQRQGGSAAGASRSAEAGNRGGFFGNLFGGGQSGGAQSSGNRSGGGAGGDRRKAALLAAYPGAFRFEGNTIVFPSGERIVWDDGRSKSPQELLTDADVEDMFAYDYPPASVGGRRPRRDEDPGRVRNDDFFRALYGGSEAEVRANLTTVPWVPAIGGGSVAATTRFGVDRKLAAISGELERLPAQLHQFVRPSAGTFNWRPIAGTRRLSVHSYGAAIDINTEFSNYWQWDEQPSNGTVLYRNEIPMEVVEVFERHCFIWGGRWYHYDTMHFEYRPELLPDCRR